MFNVVFADLECPRCGADVRVQVQFKFGSTQMFFYEIGDRLRWGALEVGRPGIASVVIDGFVGQRCPACGFDNVTHIDERGWNAYVFLRKDMIEAVELADGTHDVYTGEFNYVILEE